MKFHVLAGSHNLLITAANVYKRYFLDKIVLGTAVCVTADKKKGPTNLSVSATYGTK
jgi:hypothetical protein